MKLSLLHISLLDSGRSNGPNVSVRSLSDSLGQLSGVRSAATSTTEVLIKDLQKTDLVIFHGVWMPRFWRIAKELRRINCPYIVTPRGSLTKSSFAKSPHKKSAALLGGAYKFLQNSVYLHFLTKEEATHSVTFGKGYFIVPNGVEKPITDPMSCSPKRMEVKGLSSIDKYLLYLGRLDVYHKGLDLCLKGIIKAKHQILSKGYKIVFAGDDYRGGKRKLARAISRNSLDDLVVLKPRRIIGKEKEAHFRNASGFFHTSRYEGEPQAVLEALVRRIPVLVTEGTNMTNMVSNNELGIGVSPWPKSIANGVIEFIDRIESNFFLLQGKWEVMEERSWERVAQRTLDQYINVLKNRNLNL